MGLRSLSKILDITKGSVRGVFYLSVGHPLSSFINAFTVIIMARLLGPESYGLYIVVNIVPALLISFSDIGISPALTARAVVVNFERRVCYFFSFNLSRRKKVVI